MSNSRDRGGVPRVTEEEEARRNAAGGGPLKNYELALIRELLRVGAEQFSRHGCNDWDIKCQVVPDVDDRKEIDRSYHQYNGDPEEHDPDGEPHTYHYDWIMMSWMARRVEQAMSLGPQTEQAHHEPTETIATTEVEVRGIEGNPEAIEGGGVEGPRNYIFVGDMEDGRRMRVVVRTDGKGHTRGDLSAYTEKKDDTGRDYWEPTSTWGAKDILAKLVDGMLKLVGVMPPSV